LYERSGTWYLKNGNDRILKEELPRLVGTQYAAGDQWRNNSRKNEGMEPKQEQYPVVDVTGDRSKVGEKRAGVQGELSGGCVNHPEEKQ